MTETLICSESSRDMPEPLYGTLGAADIWFLLEYNQPWGAKAFEESAIPDTVKAHLQRVSNAKILLIRQPGQRGERDNQISFFVVDTRAQTPKIFLFVVEEYEKLLMLDFEAILQSDGYLPYDGPLFLVCTNGKRDQCCAKYGIPLYNALMEIAGESVWQCTHIGGHRFAATLLCFPHGVCYGRLGPEDARRIVDHYRKGELLLDKYRGRGVYPEVIQAAEYYLRSTIDDTRIDSLALISCEIADDVWEVVFRHIQGAHYRIYLDEHKSEFLVQQSCGRGEPEPVTQYKQIRYEIVGAD